VRYATVTERSFVVYFAYLFGRHRPRGRTSLREMGRPSHGTDRCRRKVTSFMHVVDGSRDKGFSVKGSALDALHTIRRRKTTQPSGFRRCDIRRIHRLGTPLVDSY